MKFLLLSLLAIAVLAKKKGDEEIKDLSHGYPSAIEWVEFDKAIGIAKDLNKPIFFLIHKTWCGACKNLKRELKSSPKTDELIILSRKFVMVNVEDDEEPEDPKYAPDGGYIPRILFLDTDGNPLKTNNEQKYKNNKYFYPLPAQIIDGMERALLEFGSDEPSSASSVEASPKFIFMFFLFFLKDVRD
ncbi:Protein CBG14099 [Caenorhabditis briggsae]|uniref:Protein CBG14099 n=1 Tax=Caenorhabditis briggsae TaxID=6238 RepID=A8XJC0_CAEBR|nr:Protein CBG14099 [Caenorhabditis briggsae]CAP32745.2 Protein CBG14099 [Caenorhabditis briggsae]